MKKGNSWHFGYKAHIGVDKDSGLVHTVKVTSANIHDVTMVPELLTGDEDSVYGDSGCLGAEKREDAVLFNVNGQGKGSVTKSTDGPRRVNTQTIVPAGRSNAAKRRNPPYGPR